MTTSNQETHPHASHEPIAIVGIGCRYPSAPDHRAFWRMVSDGVDAIIEIPADRFDADAFYDPRSGTPGKMAYRWGGFIPDIEGFDAAFFGISPREAASIDPQQRILLEVAWEALEDAGEVPELLAGSRTGVFIGQISSDYGDNVLGAGPGAIDSVYMLAGSVVSMSSGRISYALDLRGPSVTVDVACASSLLAVHLACQSIWSGETSLALAGGVNLVLAPTGAIAFSQGGMATRDGRCKAFAANGDGFVRSDGAGIVVLKPLAQALADANPIYAVVRGTGVSSDGRSSGLLMQPAQAGQEGALRAAYENAGVDPAEVQYVEAHGTGTSVGDPVEVAALAAVLGPGRTAGQQCLLGSVKTNIGHTEGAAGVAGVIKAALALHHRAIPASLHSAELNPLIPWADTPFVVPQKLGPWPETERALAGVNSFGISGTNVHAVLEAAPEPATTETAGTDPRLADVELGQWALLPLSARTPDGLRDHAAAWEAMLSSDDAQASTFHDMCYTASVRRTHHRCRLGVVARSRAEAAERLAAFLSGDIAAGWVGGHSPAARRKVVFVFPGQGGQWAGMGATLWQREPVFRAALERCAEAMRPFIDFSLLDEIVGQPLGGADPEHKRAGEPASEHSIDKVQPTLFALQVALAMQWKSWGITPDAVVGHSMGEVAAAHVAGALSLEDAARIVCRRSALLRRVSGKGGMAVIGLPLPDTENVLTGYAGRLSVAASNSSSATVVSGDADALDELSAELQARGVFCRPVEVDVASHSSHVDGLREDLLAALKGLQPTVGQIPWYSTVTGELGDGRDLDEDYWMRNLREPVLFAAAVTHALKDEHTVFVEVGPHPVLLGAVQQIGRDEGVEADVVASLRRDSDEQAVLLEALGRLHCLGQPVAWNGVYRSSGRCVPLPAYPWQRDRHWNELASRWRAGASGDGMSALRRRADGALAHPLLGRYLRSAARPDLHIWETMLGPQVMQYLKDHRVANTIVFPATGYVEMALAAAAEALGARQFAIEDLTLSDLLVLPDNRPAKLRLELIIEGDDQAAFQIFSDAGVVADGTPKVHAAGMLRLDRTGGELTPVMDPAASQARCPELFSREAHYDWLGRSGVVAGPAFQGVEQIWRGDREALGRLRLPTELVGDVGSYLIHPAQLDACIQVLWEALPHQDDEAPDTYVPIGITRIQLLSQPPADLWVHARASTSEAANGNVAGDIIVTDDAGRPVLLVENITAQRIGSHSRPGDQDVDRWMYAIEWENGETATDVAPERAPGRWLILGDAGGTGSVLTQALESAGAQPVLVSRDTPGEPAPKGSYHIPATDPDAWTRVLREVASGGPLRGIIHLWSLDIPEPATLTHEELKADQALSCTSVLHLVQSLASVQLDPAPRLYLVTSGVHAVGEASAEPNVAQAPMWGMGRALRYEHPELRCSMVDLSAATDQTEVEALCGEICADGDETQVTLRGPDRYLARFTPGVPRGEEDRPAVEEAPLDGSDHPFRLVNPTLGILDNMEWGQISRVAPGPGEVEIGVCAVGLIFHDLVTAMGIDVGQPKDSFAPGHECSGRITAVGPGVDDFKVGDEVIALVPNCMGSHITLPEVQVMPKPAELTFDEAAAIPYSYVTAYYALCKQGRLAAGEKVLIHSAAGGVGLAAVQVAQWVGAEIFATAGTPEKRDFLRSKGVQHVMDSRSLAFAEEVMELTGGEGVDVVLNSLRGVALERSLATVGQFGRFVEIGKRDLFEPSRRLGLQPFQKAISFMSVDLRGMAAGKPAFVGSIMREVMAIFTAHGSPKPPITVFGPEEVVDAYRFMAQGRHIGRIAVSLHGRQVQVRPAADTAPIFKDTATYLIAGGLGGVGLVLAEWMVKNGARHLVLAGAEHRRPPRMRSQPWRQRVRTS